MFFDAYKNAGKEKELQVLKESFIHDLKGTFLAYKYSKNSEEDRFVKGVSEQRFFDIWAKDVVYPIGQVVPKETEKIHAIQAWGSYLQNYAEEGIFHHIEGT